MSKVKEIVKRIQVLCELENVDISEVVAVLSREDVKLCLVKDVFSFRTGVVLNNMKIITVGDLLKIDAVTLKGSDRLLKRMFDEIEKWLKENHLSLAPVPISKNTPLKNLGLSMRAITSLFSSNIITVGDLLDYPERELCKLPGMGPVALAQVIAVIALYAESNPA